MKLFKNFFITIRTKGFIAAFLAIKSFFIILLVNIFSSSAFIKRKIFNYKMYLNPRDKGISRTLLLFGERELDHKIILEKVLKKNMNIFDIGANIGYYVLMESDLIGHGGNIIAVEPVPDNINLLKKNLDLNNNAITRVFEAAISNSSKKEKFALSSHSNLGHLISEKLNNFLDIEEKHKIINPKIISIEKLIKKTFCPDLIRMDVEGTETKILSNLISLKLKKNPIICFETHTSRYQLDKKKIKKNKKVTQMEIVLRKMFKKGYKVNLVSSSSERGSSLLKELGYQSLIEGIKTDDVIKNIFSDLNNEDAIDLICNKGGLRTILLTCGS